MRSFQKARNDWIRQEVEGDLRFMRLIPSSVVRCFVDVITSVPDETRADLWGDLIAFRDAPSKFESLSFKEALAPFRNEHEIAATWKYMPPTLKKAGAREYLSGSVREKFGLSVEAWESRLEDAGITIDSLREAQEVKSVGRGPLKNTVASYLRQRGYQPLPRRDSPHFERVTETGVMRIELDVGRNWPGFSYRFAVKTNPGIECQNFGSLEMALGITMHSTWDWIHLGSMELAGPLLAKAADVYAWICTGEKMGSCEIYADLP